MSIIAVHETISKKEKVSFKLYPGAIKEQIDLPLIPKGKNECTLYLTGRASETLNLFENSLVIEENEKKQYYLELTDKKPLFCGKCIRTMENTYVGLPQKVVSKILKFLLLILLAGVICLVSNNLYLTGESNSDSTLETKINEEYEKNSKNDLDQNDKITIESKNNGNTEETEIPQIVECIPGDEVSLEVPENKDDQENVKYTCFTKAIISKDARCIPFINSKENTTYINYIVYNDKKEIVFESGLITPDGHILWDAYEVFNTKGEHSIAIECIFYEQYADEGGKLGYMACPTSFYNTGIIIEVAD